LFEVVKQETVDRKGGGFFVVHLFPLFEGGGAKRKGDLLECWRLEQIPPAPLQKGGKAKSGLPFNPRCLKL
jgi:hypothetical protein